MLYTWINALSGLGSGKMRGVLAKGALLSGFAGLPAAAFAHHHDFRVDVVVPGPPVVVVSPQCEQRVWVEPVYRTVCDRQWIAPVYQTVCDRVWIPAVTQTQVQRVEVPAQYGYDDQVVYDRSGRQHIRRVQVQLSAAHCENRQVDVVVAPGHYEEQTHQQLVCDGHWVDVQHQELVSAGHYETRYGSAPSAEVVRPGVRLEIPLPF